MRTLVDGFNAMVGSLKAHRQELAEMGKKVAWAEMARKVAHEIKNPLTPIQLSAEHVLRVYEDRDGDFDKALRESISYIIGEVEHLRRVAQEFMEIARDTTVRRESCDLGGPGGDPRSLQESPFREDPFSGILRGADVSLSRRRGQAPDGVPEYRHQRPRGGPGKGRDHGDRPGSGPCWRVTVRDTGAGMTRAVLDKIFEPYFSTKNAGTGLGLPIARKIVEDHGGTVRVDSAAGRERRSPSIPCRSLEFRPVLWKNGPLRKGHATWPKCS